MNEDPSNAPTGSPGQCPKCGAALPADAPLGLCPACLLAAAAAPPPTTFQTTSPNRPEPPPLDLLQAAFPQLEIIELIGQGGMGVVYKARQPKLDRFVALKILPETLGKDPSFEERFTREARTLARLSHPNIVTIYDHGHAGAFFYLMMEFVDGVNLRQAMAAGKFTPAEALALVPRICEALQYAHEEGVLHRDIKPENILLDAKGRVKIADFGIAKMLGDAVPGSTLTASGAAMGTPQYMAPEQIEHPADVDHRADIFSLGVVFYEMLTGELPLGRFGPPSSKSAVDRRVDEIVFRTLEKERELRQQTAGEVKTQVEGLGPDANLRGAASGFAPRSKGHVGQGAPRVLKGQSALIFTKEILGTFAGQMLGYRHRGQVLLDEECLTVTKDGMPTIIPLSAIKDLSVGQFPRLMNPAGIDLLSVTYDDDGTTKRLFVAPMNGFIGFPSTWNNLVAEWHMAIRNAVIAATGQAPSTTPANLLGVPASSVWGVLLLFVPILALPVSIGVTLVLTAKGSHPNGAETFLSVAVVLFLLIGLTSLVLAALAIGRRGRQRAGDGASQPGRSLGAWTVGLVAIGIIAPVILVPFLVMQLWTQSRTEATQAPTTFPASISSKTEDTAASPNTGDSVQEIELKVAKQQLEKDLTELGDATREYATARAHPILILGDGPQPKTPNKEELQEKIRSMVERRDALERDIRNKAGSEAEATDIIRDIRMRVGRDQFEKTLTDIADTEKQLAKLGENSPARKGLLEKLQQLRSHSENLRREMEALSASAKPSGSVKAGPVAPIPPPQKPFEPLAHLTNALRVPFSLPKKTVGRFALAGPERVAVSGQSDWYPASQTNQLPPIAAAGASVTRGNYIAEPSKFVPSVSFLHCSVKNEPTGFWATVVASDSEDVSGELVLEPIKDGTSGGGFSTWRLWIKASGLPTQSSPSLPAPVKLAERFAFPKRSTLQLRGGDQEGTYGPTVELVVTPLDLSGDRSETKVSSIPVPQFSGPDFETWFRAMTNSLVGATEQLRRAYDPSTNNSFFWLSLREGPLEIGIWAPPAILAPRWDYQLDQLVGAFTLNQAEFFERFPSYPRPSLSGVPGRPVFRGNGSESTQPRPDSTGVNWLREEYQRLSAQAKEDLVLRSYAKSRPQAAYFPNDRVRIGLMADEAEILAAIRSGSTNQVFGAVAQP